METLKEKILFIQTAFLGDAVLTLPALQAYKRKFPHHELHVICIPSTKAIFSNSPSVSEVIVLDKKGEHKNILRFLNFSKEIKNKLYYKIFSFHRSFRTSLLVLRSGVKETTGFNNSSFKYVYKNLIEYRHKDHEVKRNLLLTGLDCQEDWKILPEVNPAPEKVLVFLEKHKIKEGFTALAPGTIWNTKKYPMEYFREIVKFFTDNNKNVVLIGSLQDEEICSSLVINEKVISSAGLFNSVESIYLLKNSSLLISNDSAPAHLAHAADIPVIMLYCSTVPGFGFYPYNQGSSYLSYEHLDCKPCGIHGYNKCPLGHFKCGYELKPEIVINHLKEKYSECLKR